MFWKRVLVLMFCLNTVLACGSSKSGWDPGPRPDLEKRQRPVLDKDTLMLKSEDLKLTHFTQTWKLNSFSQGEGAEKYLRVEKFFPFPIQFNGWISIDNVSLGFVNCEEISEQEAEFLLKDDHNGAVVLRAGEKVAVQLEKLYEIRVLYPNSGMCSTVDIQFGVLYGTRE